MNVCAEFLKQKARVIIFSQLWLKERSKESSVHRGILWNERDREPIEPLPPIFLPYLPPEWTWNWKGEKKFKTQGLIRERGDANKTNRHFEWI